MPSAAVNRRHDNESLDLAALALLSSTAARIVRVAASHPGYRFGDGVLRSFESMKQFVNSLSEADMDGHLDEIATGGAALADGRSLQGVGRLVGDQSSRQASTEDLRDLFGLDAVIVEGNSLNLGSLDADLVSRALDRFALAASHAQDAQTNDAQESDFDLAFC